MPIDFNCPKCSKSYRVQDKFAGQQATCKSCGFLMPIPSVDRDPLTTAAPSRRPSSSSASLNAPPLSPSSAPPSSYMLQDEVDALNAGPSKYPPAVVILLSILKSGWFWAYTITISLALVARSSGIAAAILCFPVLTAGALVAALRGFAMLTLACKGHTNWLMLRRPLTASGYGAVMALLGAMLWGAADFSFGGFWHSLPSIPQFGTDATAVNWQFPDRPAAQTLQTGVDLYVTQMRGSGPASHTNLWVYLPSGTHPDQSLPCVFVAPAGTPLICGNSLGAGDRAEHLPYVHAGFAVVAYDLDGPMDISMNNRQILDALRAFHNAKGGTLNAKAAIDFVAKKFPEIDQKHLYAAGHSSAATVALDVAAADHRIAAVAAYAPAVDVPRFAASGLAKIEPQLPEIRAYATEYSPNNHLTDIDCPVFLFVADDDPKIAAADLEAYAAQLDRPARPAKVSRIPTGGHYDAMIHTGLPRAITWLQAITPERFATHETHTSELATAPAPDTTNPLPTALATQPTSLPATLTQPPRSPALPPDNTMATATTPPADLTTPIRPSPRRPNTPAIGEDALNLFTLDGPKGFTQDKSVPPDTRQWTRTGPGRSVSSTYTITVRWVGPYWRTYSLRDQNATFKAGDITFHQSYVNSTPALKTVRWEGLSGEYLVTLESTCDTFDLPVGDALSNAAKSIRRKDPLTTDTQPAQTVPAVTKPVETKQPG